MSILYPCRHGRSKRDCVICANEKVAEAVNKQTETQLEIEQRRQEEARKARDAQQRAERRSRREAAQQARQRDEAADRQARRDADTQRAQLNRLAEERRELGQQRQALEQEDLARRLRADADAKDRVATQQAEEQRRLWRAGYKQRTGITDDDLVEAAWVAHRDKRELLRESDLATDRLNAALVRIDDTLRQLTGNSRRAPGLHTYNPQPALPDPTPVTTLQAQLDSLPRVTLKRGRLETQLQDAKANYAKATTRLNMLLASNRLWESMSAGLLRLHQSWPHQYANWDSALDRDSLNIASQAPAVPHNLVPGELAAAGLDYRTEVLPVLKLLTAIDDVPRLTQQITDIASRVVAMDS